MSDKLERVPFGHREPGKCYCETCVFENKYPGWFTRLESGFEYYSGPMIVCEICGNKRCPHATHHDNPCTGSNEPGQKGSSWENYKVG